MLDKIKVYRRSDAKEIDSNICRIGLGESLTIFIGAIATLEEQRYFLSKTDPLGKFKKEMHNWWFCNKYVVIIDNIDKIYLNINNELQKTDSLHNNFAWFVDICIIHNKNIKHIYCDNYYKYNIYLDKTNDNYHAKNFISSLEKIFNKIHYHKHHNFPDKITSFSYTYSYSSVGENKYLQLLELL